MAQKSLVGELPKILEEEPQFPSLQFPFSAPPTPPTTAPIIPFFIFKALLFPFSNQYIRRYLKYARQRLPFDATTALSPQQKQILQRR